MIGTLVDAEVDVTGLQGLLGSASVRIEPLQLEDAERAEAMRSLPGERSSSLGDRCCLALGIRSTPPTVLTADRAWADLDLPVHVHLIR